MDEKEINEDVRIDKEQSQDIGYDIGYEIRKAMKKDALNQLRRSTELGLTEAEKDELVKLLIFINYNF